MTKQEVVQKIEEWEFDNGESFNDYFSHDSIDATHWAEFLSKHGHDVVSKQILEECASNKNGWCMDQQLMFELYPLHDEDGNWIEGSNDTLNKTVLVDYFFENEDLLESAKNFLNEN